MLREIERSLWACMEAYWIHESASIELVQEDIDQDCRVENTRMIRKRDQIEQQLESPDSSFVINENMNKPE